MSIGHENTGQTDAGAGTPDVQLEEKFRMEYEVVNDYILHYSNVRSALASFLITVALASFGGYYSTRGNSSINQQPLLGVEKGPHILWVAGYLFLLAAVVSSLYFSYHTERATEYSRRLWKWGIRKEAAYPGGFRGKWTDSHGQPLPSCRRRQIVWRQVEKDLMNWVLILGALAIAVAFYLFEVAL